MFELFTTKIPRKVKELCLNRGDNFSANIIKNGTGTKNLFNNFYGEITLANWKAQTETVWVDTSNPGKVKTDKDTILRHMCFQVIENFLTENAMIQMMSREN